MNLQKSKYETIRDNNIKEKKEMYFEYMGEKYPENGSVQKKRVPTKNKNDQTNKTTTVNRRKSLRNENCVVNYKELSTASIVKQKKPNKKAFSDVNCKAAEVRIEETIYTDDQVNDINTEVENTARVCDLCNFELKDITELKIHIRTFHKRFL
eukprot:GFUD01024241.1.p1 GENE.GFUD01024241.1~~GFUD01024241.1.p1  ORF type:complete len:153 (+),score=37.54 GFUD01024241.1:69-527(+)